MKQENTQNNQGQEQTDKPKVVLASKFTKTSERFNPKTGEIINSKTEIK